MLKRTMKYKTQNFKRCLCFYQSTTGFQGYILLIDLRDQPFRDFTLLYIILPSKIELWSFVKTDRWVNVLNA